MRPSSRRIAERVRQAAIVKLVRTPVESGSTRYELHVTITPGSRVQLVDPDDGTVVTQRFASEQPIGTEIHLTWLDDRTNLVGRIVGAEIDV